MRHSPTIGTRHSALSALAAALLGPIGPAQVARPAPVAPTEPALYTVQDLGTIPASNVCRCFFGVAINDRTQMVGRFFGTNGRYHGFQWSQGVMIDLGSLGGGLTQVLALNDHGVAAGLSEDLAGTSHAFVFQNGVMTALRGLGGVHSDARAINNAGVVAGSAQTRRDNYSHATLWTNGTPTDLGTLGGEFSEAYGINDAGQVVGWAWNQARQPRAFLWRAGQGMIDLGDLGAGSAMAAAVNEAGFIVGSSQAAGQPAGSTHAFLWAQGLMLDLGVLPEAGRPGKFGPELVNTAATGINDLLQVVGNSYPGTLRPGPFLWQGGFMVNLNDLIDPGSGWTITDAGGINNRGEIIATGRSAAGDIRAVLLAPRP